MPGRERGQKARQNEPQEDTEIAEDPLGYLAFFAANKPLHSLPPTAAFNVTERRSRITNDLAFAPVLSAAVVNELGLLSTLCFPLR